MNKNGIKGSKMVLPLIELMAVARPQKMTRSQEWPSIFKRGNLYG